MAKFDIPRSAVVGRIHADVCRFCQGYRSHRRRARRRACSGVHCFSPAIHLYCDLSLHHAAALSGHGRVCPYPDPGLSPDIDLCLCGDRGHRSGRRGGSHSRGLDAAHVLRVRDHRSAEILLDDLPRLGGQMALHLGCASGGACGRRDDIRRLSYAVVSGPYLARPWCRVAVLLVRWHKAHTLLTAAVHRSQNPLPSGITFARVLQ